MEPYNSRNHTLILLKDFLILMEQGFPFNQQDVPEEDVSFHEQLKSIISSLENPAEDAIFDGQAWISRLFRNYPSLAPHMGREVLWYFGGEALHFMPDEEIAKFQQLEEALAASLESGEDFNYLELKSKLFNQH